jgi:membrane protease YdiL (CAAX protease family)
MSAIAASPAVTAVSETSEQHSIGKSLALHILPGVFILTLFVATAPLLMSIGFPPMLAITIGATFGLAYQVWHLYSLGRKRNGKWSLEGIVLYRRAMPVWQYFALLPLFVILAFLIDGLTKPVGVALLSYLPWLPQWFEMRDAGQLLGYSRSALVLTFGVSLLVNGIAAPIIEESYFRGYLMSRLSRFGRWTPVVETALFTLYHFWQPYYWVSQFLFTLPYVFAVAWKRNVRLGILIHMALNLLGGLLTAALILGQV